MVSSSQIREQLALLLDNRIDLDQFEDWFVQNTWNVHLSRSLAAESLTFAIEESFSERSNGLLSDKALYSEFAKLLNAETTTFEFADAPQVVWSFKPSAAAVFLPAVVLQ
jgi:hypothetical protein